MEVWDAVMKTRRWCQGQSKRPFLFVWQQPVKPEPLETVLGTRHCVFEDKDNCVKFQPRSLHWLRGTASEALRVLAGVRYASVLLQNILEKISYFTLLLKINRCPHCQPDVCQLTSQKNKNYIRVIETTANHFLHSMSKQQLWVTQVNFFKIWIVLVFWCL